MEKTFFIKDALKESIKPVELQGWVWQIRKQKKMIFIVLRDSSGIIQCVVKDDKPFFKDADGLTQESSVVLQGTVKKDERAPTGYEMSVSDMKIIHLAERWPITKDTGTVVLQNLRHLHLRSPKFTAVMKIKSTILQAAQEYFISQGFYQVTAPVFVTSAGESGSEQFEIKNYFGKKIYLTQTSQLHIEALSFGLEKVFSLLPSFRAEKSKTRRHLTEFTHLEPEVAWCDDEGIMRYAEEMIAHVVKRVLERHRDDLKLLGRDISALEKIKAPFPRITYADALQRMAQKGFAMKWGDDFGAEEERILTQDFGVPFFVTNYPKEVKAFYMKINGKDPRTVKNFDLLAPEGYGEIIGGSEREVDLKSIVERLKEKGEKPEHYEWYLDLRRFGSVPHSGFGLGVERIVMWICGLKHIRNATPFPRRHNRVYP
jgi:asparaginyl-tRNA synthetase